MLIIGVDPGLTGAMSFIDTTSGQLLACVDLPTESNGMASGSMRRWIDVAALYSQLAEWSCVHRFVEHDVHAVIERPIPMPNLPAQTIASQFDCFGVLRAALDHNCSDMHFVEPRVWKKSLGLRTDKNASRELAARLYPNAPVARVKDHNRAEAVLIAHWAKLEFA